MHHRFSSDAGSHLAASLTYYGFLSLFPLLLLGLAVVGFLVAGDPGAQAEWASRLAQGVPGAGTILARNLRALAERRGDAGAIALLGLLWTSTGAVGAAGDAIDRVWHGAVHRGLVAGRVHDIGWTVILGALALAGVGLGALAAALPADDPAEALVHGVALAASLGADVALFVIAYRVLGSRKTSYRTVLPGALAASTGWFLLKVAGSWYAARTVAGAAEVYGTFASVIGIFVMLHLAARLFLYGAALNAVLADRGRKA